MVKRIIQFCLAVAFLVAFVAPARSQEISKDTIKCVKRAVVIVTTYDSRGKPLLQGSGFFVASNQLITNLHVLKNACRAQIKTFDGKTYPVEGIVAVNERSDLALVQANVASSQLTTLAIEETLPGEGEEIVLVSNPRGSSWKVSRGVTEALWDFQGLGELIRITAAVAPGSSGGPVVNRSCRVVGIAVMHTNSADDLNFAVPGELIKTLRPGPLSPLPGLQQTANQISQNQSRFPSVLSTAH